MRCCTSFTPGTTKDARWVGYLHRCKLVIIPTKCADCHMVTRRQHIKCGTVQLNYTPNHIERRGAHVFSSCFRYLKFCSGQRPPNKLSERHTSGTGLKGAPEFARVLRVYGDRVENMGPWIPERLRLARKKWITSSIKGWSLAYDPIRSTVR